MTARPVPFTASAIAAEGRGLIVLTSMSWIDGAGFGGLNRAGNRGIKEAGGFCSSSMARTVAEVSLSHARVSGTYDRYTAECHMR
jgi:hypothetical protein